MQIAYLNVPMYLWLALQNAIFGGENFKAFRVWGRSKITFARGGGGGVNWVQTSANLGEGGCLRPANVCKNTIKSQLSLKTFTKIVLDKEYCQDFHIAILDQVTLMVGFSTMYSYGVKNLQI